jgi:hypothetical protein
MTKIIYGDTIEVEPTQDRPNREMLQTLSYADALRDNPGIKRRSAERLAGLAADLILRDYDLLQIDTGSTQTDTDNNLIGE